MEAQKNDYFIDGFCIKHFGIWPLNIDKDNLCHEQKIFLIYLMGVIPTIEEWQVDVGYKIKQSKIEKLSINDIKLSEEDIDLIRLQSKNEKEVKLKRLRDEKKKRFEELDKKYGIIPDDEYNFDNISVNEEPDNDPAKLWELLQMKGLIKNG